MTGFLSPKVRNKASWVTFGSKPTTEPIFTKIGLGGRTGPYIRIRRFLMDGLLKSIRIRPQQFLGTRTIVVYSSYARINQRQASPLGTQHTCDTFD